MMLGLAGSIEGSPAYHYIDASVLADGCVSCHMANSSHTFMPNVRVCQECHVSATNFDINGFQTLTQARLDAIGAELVALGYDTGGIDGIFGLKTRRAISAFQEQQQLPVTGEADA